MRASAHMILHSHMPCIHIEDPIVTRVSLTAPYGGRTYEAVIQSLLRQLQFVAYTTCLSKTNVSSKIQELCPQQTYKRKTPNAHPRWLDCLIAKQQISCLLKPSNPFLTGQQTSHTSTNIREESRTCFRTHRVWHMPQLMNIWMKGHIEEIQQKNLKTNSPHLSSKNMFSKPTADYKTQKMAMLYTVRSHHFCASLRWLALPSTVDISSLQLEVGNFTLLLGNFTNMSALQDLS